MTRGPEAEVAHVRPGSRIIHETIDGEVIIVHLDTGAYYSLRDVAARVWTLLDAGATATEIVDRIDLEYDSRRGEIEVAVGDFLRELDAEGLVFPAQASAANVEREMDDHDQPSVRRVFAPPALEKHTDMQDLILLDPVHEVDARGWPYANGTADA
jgi:Coenzyme PQQ synthesis protein D (PqqD)